MFFMGVYNRHLDIKCSAGASRGSIELAAALVKIESHYQGVLL